MIFVAQVLPVITSLPSLSRSCLPFSLFHLVSTFVGKINGKKINSFCLIHFKFAVLCSICFDISMLNYGTRSDPFLDELQLIILAS